MTRRQTPLAALLAQLRRTPSPACWRVRCRDSSGRRTTVRIGLGDSGVRLHVASPGPLEFDPLNLGRLRNALREAVVAYSELQSVGPRAQEHDTGDHESG